MQRSTDPLELQLLKAAVENAQDGIMVTDATLDAPGPCIVFVNPAHAAMYGYRPEEQIGRTWRMLYSGEETQRIQQEVFPRLSAAGRWSGCVQGLRKDGTTFDVELNLTVTPTGDLVCACRDITERRAAEEALRRANLELANASRAKDAFLASMSHELRTPLAGILAMVELLDAELHGPLNEHQAAYVRSIEASGRHLLELIGDILDLAKVGSGTMELALGECFVDEICQAGIRLVDDAARKKGHVIELELPGLRLRMVADARRLKQVLVNLLDNAVKFTPAGRRIGLRASARGMAEGAAAEVCFEVWDTGIGIPTEARAHLFEPFFQAEALASHAPSGAGLGLALVKKLVELHRGRVELESSPGRGTRFRVYLPIVDAEERGRGRPLPMPVSGGDSRSPRPPARILVAEDNAINAAAFRDYLLARGFDVRVVVDGEMALETAASWRPHAMIMDVQMPRMDGLTAIQRLREHPDPLLARVPILVVTAYAMPGDEERCMASGADAYRSKPVNLRELADWLARMTRRPTGEGAAGGAGGPDMRADGAGTDPGCAPS